MGRSAQQFLKAPECVSRSSSQVAKDDVCTVCFGRYGFGTDHRLPDAISNLPSIVGRIVSCEVNNFCYALLVLGLGLILSAR
jgi:hypothetical protein